MITSRGIKCSISQIIVPDDKLWHKVSKVNDSLAKKVTEGISIINHDSITVEHLNRSRLHLNHCGGVQYDKIYKNVIFRPTTGLV